jgi:hypothetical protein
MKSFDKTLEHTKVLFSTGFTSKRRKKLKRGNSKKRRQNAKRRY